MKAEGFKKMTAHWLSRHHCDACRIRSGSLLQRQLPYMPNTSDQEGIPIPLISWRQLPESGDGMRGIMDSMRYRQWPHLQYDFIQQLSERAQKERRRGVLCLSLRSEDATISRNLDSGFSARMESLWRHFRLYWLYSYCWSCQCSNTTLQGFKSSHNCYKSEG